MAGEGRLKQSLTYLLYARLFPGHR